MTITLHPGNVTLAELAAIYWDNGRAKLDRSFDAGIKSSGPHRRDRRRQRSGLWHQYRFRQTRLDQDRRSRCGDATA